MSSPPGCGRIDVSSEPDGVWIGVVGEGTEHGVTLTDAGAVRVALSILLVCARRSGGLPSLLRLALRRN